MRRGSASAPVNLRDYGNLAASANGEVNLKDLARCDAPAPRRPSIFQMAFSTAAFEAELDVGKSSLRKKNQATIENPNTGQRLNKQSVVHHVVNDDVQWSKLQAQMRAKKTVTGMTLKQNIDDLLQKRAADLDSNDISQQQQQRRTSIADFATSLIIGEGGNNRRLSVGGAQRRLSPLGNQSSMYHHQRRLSPMAHQSQMYHHHRQPPPATGSRGQPVAADNGGQRSKSGSPSEVDLSRDDLGVKGSYHTRNHNREADGKMSPTSYEASAHRGFHSSETHSLEDSQDWTPHEKARRSPDELSKQSRHRRNERSHRHDSAPGQDGLSSSSRHRRNERDRHSDALQGSRHEELASSSRHRREGKSRYQEGDGHMGEQHSLTESLEDFDEHEETREKKSQKKSKRKKKRSHSKHRDRFPDGSSHESASR